MRLETQVGGRFGWRYARSYTFTVGDRLEWGEILVIRAQCAAGKHITYTRSLVVRNFYIRYTGRQAVARRFAAAETCGQT